MHKYLMLMVATLFFIGCTPPEMILLANQAKGDMPKPELQDAYFAGGCFWCTESDFEKLPGVYTVISGFSGGEAINPTYQQVSSGSTQHTETVKVSYDPSAITYLDLLVNYWQMFDPTDSEGSFVDRGSQYRPAIFYTNPQEKVLAETARDQLDELNLYNKPIATEIVPFTIFYAAEEYHQDYHTKNPVRYKYYRSGSGRDQFLSSIWNKETIELVEKTLNPNSMSYKKPSDEELRELLTAEQYDITQNEGTEPPFKNEYWDNKEEGIYVDLISGEALFSSTDKYVSGTGWPSFTKPIDNKNIVTKEDRRLLSVRTEVRSKLGDAHLGHVFPDGPEPTGQRWCMNSAALKFIPKADLKKEGYGEYAYLFVTS